MTRPAEWKKSTENFQRFPLTKSKYLSERYRDLYRGTP